MIDPADGAVLEAVRGVSWPARRVGIAGAAGVHRSRARGGTAEFAEYRAYRPGDDVRRIDWKLLARSDRAAIRLSADRTVLSTLLLVDASASMAHPRPSLEKWRYARGVTLALAAMAAAAGDPVGVMVAAPTGVIRRPPRTRRGVTAEIAALLHAVEPGGSPALAPVLATMRRARRIAIVSDCLGDADTMLRVASIIAAAGGEVHAVHIVHIGEAQPDARDHRVIDPEDTGVVRTLTASSRQGYLDAFGAFQAAMAHRWRSAGASYTRVVTDEPVAHAARRIARC
ncbi:MAG TPA: DUF58 domain-containing protein [Gemmatimonadaceae bacterium]|nr:DUF58 domain-containing protein [Gemmatimonadaceae bacterium]